MDWLRVPVRANPTTLGTLAWISIGRVRAGVDSLHLRGWACDAESDAGWHGVKARARPDIARGMVRITRHPFLWGVALWALVHLISTVISHP